MKTKVALVVAITAAFTFLLYGGPAFAAGHAKTMPALKPVSLDLSGKISIKQERVGYTDMYLSYLVVSDARTADGKPYPGLNGRSIQIAGHKVSETYPLSGHDVVLKGTFLPKGPGRFTMTSIINKSSGAGKKK
jgi:hypothetical protein